MSLDRPIFIVGNGRSGTSIFHDIFAYHPQVAFLSQLCSRYPGHPKYNRWLMQLLDVKFLRRLVRRKSRSEECYDFWDHYFLGFGNPARDLSAQDVRPKVKAKLTRSLEEMLTRKRHRLLVKLTGWPRIGFLREICPDALFIHIIRDGRAVANSLLDVAFWDGWRGPPFWRFGELTPAYQDEWERSQRSFVVLAGLQWKLLMDAFDKAKKLLPPNQFLEVRYEDFVAAPSRCFEKVLAFCQLDNPEPFRKQVESFTVRDMNYKWKKELTPYQQEILQASLKDYLTRYGYALCPPTSDAVEDCASNATRPQGDPLSPRSRGKGITVS